MGLITVTMLVKGKRGRSRNVEMLVDSGVVWSLLPKEDWEAPGLKADAHAPGCRPPRAARHRR